MFSKFVPILHRISLQSEGLARVGGLPALAGPTGGELHHPTSTLGLGLTLENLRWHRGFPPCDPVYHLKDTKGTQNKGSRFLETP